MKTKIPKYLKNCLHIQIKMLQHCQYSISQSLNQEDAFASWGLSFMIRVDYLLLQAFFDARWGFT